jgi:peptidylprolyl isomerase
LNPFSEKYTYAMRRLALLLACAATITAAQTPTTTTPSTATPAPAKKPATPAAKTAAKASTATTAKTGTGTAAKSTVASAVKFPPGVKPSLKVMRTAFALRYQDIEVGTGPVAEPLKLYKVKYTGWLAADGKKFDSSEDHPGKEPIQFPQGRGRVIPGWDQGFEGMKIGGKRRIFIPWQLAYGAAGRAPVIPGKSDLVFDVELVDVTDMPAQGMPGGPGGRPMPQRPAAPGANPANPSATPQPGAPQSTPPPATPTTAPQATPPPSTTTPPPADKPTQPQQ